MNSSLLSVLIAGIVFVLIATLAAAANWKWNPNSIERIEAALAEGEVPMQTALAWPPASILWVDARTVDEFADAHIPGAILLNEDDWYGQLDALFSELELAPDRRLIVYCSSESCLRSHEVAERIRTEIGIPDVFVLRDGWEGWLAENNL